MKVLLIDDREPDLSIGYGFPRASLILTAVRQNAAQLRCWWSEAVQGPGLPTAGFSPVPPDLVSRADMIWVSRTRNFYHNRAALAQRRPDQACIFDVEAITSERLKLAAAAGDSGARDEAVKVADRERLLGRAANLCVAVNERDARSLRRDWQIENVQVVGHEHDLGFGANGHRSRRGMLMVAGFYRVPCPNEDAVEHFLSRIAPLLGDALLAEHPLTIAGHNAEILRARPVAPLLEKYRVRIRSNIADLASLYDSHRLVVIPTRIGAGLAFKATEAVCAGLPFVASSVIGSQLPFPVPSSDDPCEFAGMATLLLTEPGRWQCERDNLRRHRAAYAPGIVRDQVGRVFADAGRLMSAARELT